MKRIISLSLLIALAFSLAGCCSVNISHKGNVDLVTIENSCWRLLNFVPLVSGNPDHPNSWKQSWFRNTATLQDNVKIVDRTLTQGGYRDYANLVSFRSEEKILFFIVARTTYHTSAELINHE
ncbi:MAG: hypothetical protein MJ109_02090 [Kiritimatiellae bacterium]|nr:hypothetical protein [Kiritimatiellia bacterium]